MPEHQRSSPPFDRRLLRASSSVRWALASSVALGLLATLGVIVQAWALSRLLASGFVHHGGHINQAALEFLCAGIALRVTAATLSEPLARRSANRAAAHMEARLIAAAVDGDPQWRSQQSTATLALTLTRGVDATVDHLSRYVPALLLAAMAPFVVLVAIAYADPLSGGIVLATVVVLPIFMVLLGKEASDKMNRSWAATSHLAGHFSDVLRGMRTLRSFNRADMQLRQLETSSEALRQSTMATLRVALLSSFALELLSSLATALVALSLGIRLLSGHMALSTALAVLIVTPEVYLPLRRSSARFHEAADAVGASSALLDLEQSRPTRLSESKSGKGVLDDLAAGAVPEIVFDSVQVAFEGREIFAEPLSWALGAGEHAVVLGPSGVGKSTVLNLVLGIQVPDTGQLRINGVDFSHIDLRSWRRLIGYLPQRSTDPGNTLRELVALRDPGISDTAIADYLEDVGLGELLHLPGGLDCDAATVLRTTSTGQRRRLATLRSLLGTPRVLLLDEAFAHLDHVSADLIARTINRLSGDATLLATLHEQREWCAEFSSLNLGSKVIHA